MDRLSPSYPWMMRALYAGVALVILFFHLLPLNTLPSRWAPPDLLLAMTFAWTLRRPDYVPILLVAFVMLMADLLLQRPPGLLSALTVGACAYLRTISATTRDAGIVGEWITVATVLTAITLGNRLILGLTSVELVSIWLVTLQLVLTIAAYPLVVWVSQSVLGIRRLTSAETEALGGRA